MLPTSQGIRSGGPGYNHIYSHDWKILWANDNDVLHVPEDSHVSVLRQESFDYLFAITHLKHLPDEVTGSMSPERSPLVFPEEFFA